MKLLVASVANLLFLSEFGNAYAGPYDGEWTGSATATNRGRCKPANVTLTVDGKDAIGQARFDLGGRDIRGTVAADGTFGASIGFQYLTGKFTQDKFEGTFNSFDCAWNIVLKRTK